MHWGLSVMVDKTIENIISGFNPVHIFVAWDFFFKNMLSSFSCIKGAQKIEK